VSIEILAQLLKVGLDFFDVFCVLLVLFVKRHDGRHALVDLRGYPDEVDLGYTGDHDKPDENPRKMLKRKQYIILFLDKKRRLDPFLDPEIPEDEKSGEGSALDGDDEKLYSHGGPPTGRWRSIIMETGDAQEYYNN
jgi:hypothetical protein